MLFLNFLKFSTFGEICQTASTLSCGVLLLWQWENVNKYTGQVCNDGQVKGRINFDFVC